MKPYRGTRLASAILLSVLPLIGCGDADDWEKTSEVKLSSNTTTVQVRSDVIFTVVSTPPDNTEEGNDPATGATQSPYQCETLLEYRAEGAGLDAYWHDVPGSGPRRVFSLAPRLVEPFAVVARGKCAGAKEDWKYSDQVNVTVTAKP